MNKNDKGKMMIRSLDELTHVQRKQIRLASFGVGFFVLLVVVLAFLAFGSFPSKNSPLFFYCTDWILLIATPCASFGFGAAFGFELMLSDLGYVLSFGYRGGSDSLSLNQPFSSYDSPNYQHANNYSSPVNINPSSGRPMSGSSGMDISGNPYGTRSW
jgi:hypothetical protein